MKEVMGHILEIALAAIIITFLIVMLYSGKMDGQSGILNALFHNGYNSVSDNVNQNTNSTVRAVMSSLPDDFNINYIQGTQEIARPVGDGNGAAWQNLYKFEDFVTVRYENNDYKYNKSTKKWQVRSGNGYVNQTGSNQKNFRIYISDITDSYGKNVLLSDKISSLGEDIPNKILYDDDSDQIACFIPGTYNFTVKVTETSSKNVIEKIISIPFAE